MATLYIGQDFGFEVDLRRKDKPHRINDAAVVRAAIYDRSGNILTGWTTYTKNSGAGSDWQLGLLEEAIPSAEIANIPTPSSNAELRINIQGQYQAADLTLGDTYDLTWDWALTVK